MTRVVNMKKNKKNFTFLYVNTGQGTLSSQKGW